MSQQVKSALIIGIIPAILEGLLIYFFDSKASKWVIIESMFFWYSAAMIIYLIELPISELVKSILFSLVLATPWFIQEVFIFNNLDHLLPLIISSGIMGLIIGLISKKLKKRA
jgi:hypothetical protein